MEDVITFWASVIMWDNEKPLSFHGTDWRIPESFSNTKINREDIAKNQRVVW